MSDSIYAKLLAIQSELKVPKNQYNSFGKYPYRSCEDIVEEAKPILKKHNTVTTISDKMIEVGNRVYVEATARLTCIETKESITVTASAREAESKKGMDASQITGATSSYARKYALNGLYAIDDTKDADSMRPERKEVAKVQEVFPNAKEITYEVVEKQVNSCKTKKELKTIYDSEQVQAFWKAGDDDRDFKLTELFKNKQNQLNKEIGK
jgi:hypothetical protein